MSNRTEISTLGEFGLIRHLTDKIELKNPSTLKGVGDDAAVLDYTDKQVLVTTDLLLEGIHFDLMYVPLKHLGYKSAVVNFSDISRRKGCHTRRSQGIIRTLKHDAADTISITCLGEGEKGKVVYRNGAKETDLICVSGDLGAAYMGLQLLEREKSIFNGEKDFTPDFSGKEYLLERQLKPEARKDIVEVLDQAGIVPTSMMDISDGLSSELLHISKESNVGCRVYEDRIPIDYQTAAMAEQFNMNLITAALNGGEDYELLFTVPLADHDKVSEMKGIKVIGHITKPELGNYLVGRDGGEVELKAQGWNSLN